MFNLAAGAVHATDLLVGGGYVPGRRGVDRSQGFASDVTVADATVGARRFDHVRQDGAGPRVRV